MGHCVKHSTYSATWTLERIAQDVIDYVNHSGDCYGTDYVKMPTDKVFDTYEEAEAYICKIDRGDYDGIAVKYLDFSDVEDSNKIKELRAKIADTVQKQKDYILTHSVKSQKATYIGCRSCGSKLNKEKLKGECCPLCGTDLRATSTLERISSFKTRIDEYNKKIITEQLKLKKKAKIQWLVKFEYHC